MLDEFRVLSLLALAASTACAQAPLDSLHRYETYAVPESFHGTPVSVDLTSSPHASRFGTVLRQGAASGPNFAGHYTVVIWGCGTSCQQLAIVDAATGKVWIHDRALEVRARFQRGSALLVAGAPEDWYAAWDRDPLPERAFTFYYRWTGHTLALVDSVRVPSPRP